MHNFNNILFFIIKPSSVCTMGSPCDTEDSGIFEDTRWRIDRAFEHLRREMKEIQKQDLCLLKQLMHIRHTILLLGRYGDRRCYSIGSLDPGVPEALAQRQEVSTPPSYYFRQRPSLTRVQSAPLESHVSEEIIEEEDEEEVEGNVLMESFSSTASESHVNRRAVPQSTLGVPPSLETDFIYAMGPLPPVFKRHLVSTSSPTESPSGGYDSLLNHVQQNNNNNSNVVSPTHLSILRNKGFSRSCETPASSSPSSDKSNKNHATRKRMLQRQKSVEDYDNAGEMIFDHLQRVSLSTTTAEVEV